MLLSVIRISVFGLLIGLLLSVLGCNIGHKTNPSFDLSVEDAWAALEEMAANPKTPTRPVLITGGWQGKGFDSIKTYQLAEQALGKENLVVVTYDGINKFSGARTRTIEAVAALGDPAKPGYTPEVDVIGVSMGGIVARDAACPPRPQEDDPRRLKIHTLYGISVPHRGVRLGVIGFYDSMAKEMFKNSETNGRIKSYFKPGEYEIQDYGRLGDPWVGVDNATLPGHFIRWLPNTTFGDAHLGFQDPRIVADILRRLRGEEPFSTDPPSPVP